VSESADDDTEAAADNNADTDPALDAEVEKETPPGRSTRKNEAAGTDPEADDEATAVPSAAGSVPQP
jgi:hypothetical protein